MTRTHLAAALALAAAVLAGCGSDPTPAAAPTSAPAASSAAPSATPDGRAACREVGGDLDPARDFDVALNQQAGRLATASSDRDIALAGQQLVDAANGALAEPGPDANLEMMEARLALAKACVEAFGDGPW